MSPRSTRVVRSSLAAALLLAVSSSASAQEPTPPSGPAQIFNRAAQDRQHGDVAKANAATEAAAQQANPEPAQAQGPSAPVDPDHADHPHAVLEPPSMPMAQPAPELPVGSIAIDVTGPDGKPYPGAEIVLGVMSSMSARSEQRAKADGSGHYQFKDLPVGSKQAYRVNVIYAGAKFSSTPFRLPDDSGYRAQIPLKATTQDDRLFVQLVGQTVVEIRDDRLHITQQARLANAGADVFVLPKDGLVIPLPEGFTAFQWQEQMTDQRGEEVKERGFRLRGSFPPGTATVAWTFDLKRSGSSARIPVDLPWKTYSYRIISEAPEGSKLRVSDFPEPERVKDEGRDLWFTQIQKQPGDPLLGAFSVKLDGIPGPGPGRWIATVLASLFAVFGLVRAFKRSDDSAERKTYIAARKQALLGEARATEEEHLRGDSGPEYRAQRIAEIETELAMLLRDEEGLRA